MLLNFLRAIGAVDHMNLVVVVGVGHLCLAGFHESLHNRLEKNDGYQMDQNEKRETFLGKGVIQWILRNVELLYSWIL